jgi:hypothetical protein
MANIPPGVGIASSLSDKTINLIENISTQRIVRATLFISWILLIHDWILVFDVEVERIWKARWTPVKGAYVVFRTINVIIAIVNTYRE